MLAIEACTSRSKGLLMRRLLLSVTKYNLAAPVTSCITTLPVRARR
jgi:hypothetical protein